MSGLRTAWLILAGAIILTGCAADGIRDTAQGLRAREANFWNPHRLILQRAPYPSLHVEVDAVSGAEPDAGHLAAMREFLEEAADKPGGVRISRSDTIPLAAARGRPPGALALRYIDGPANPRAAFIYILFYDSAVAGTELRSPETTLLPYPAAIFVDRQHDPFGMLSELGDIVLIHEAGHVLGLTRNLSHGDGAHCFNPACLMNEALEFSVPHRLLGQDPWRQREFCAECLADLAEARRGPPPDPNLRFLGPFLVRSEPLYTVATGPDFVYFTTGPTESVTRDGLFAMARAAASGITSSDDVEIIAHASLRNPVAVSRTARALRAARNDPYSAIRSAAGELEAALEAGLR